jgi:4'-phosphopantetheinyl transferase
LLSGASPVLTIGDRTELWTLALGDVEPGELDVCSLDEQERRRAALLKRESDRLGFTAAHQLLRQLLGLRLGCRPEQVAYGRERCPVCGGPNGRPVVRSPSATLHFSHSRSEGVILIGLAPAPIGVDIQQISSPHDVVALLHPREQTEIRSASPERRDELFTRLWARREAYLKGLGTGIAHDMATDYLGSGLDADPPPNWEMLDVPAPAGYYAAAAIKRGERERR